MKLKKSYLEGGANERWSLEKLAEVDSGTGIMESSIVRRQGWILRHLGFMMQQLEGGIDLTQLQLLQLIGHHIVLGSTTL